MTAALELPGMHGGRLVVETPSPGESGVAVWARDEHDQAVCIRLRPHQLRQLAEHAVDVANEQTAHAALIAAACFRRSA